MVLGDIGVSVDFVAGSDQIRTLKANGAVDQAYTYATKEMFAEWNVPGESGWYLTSDIQDNSINDYTGLIKNGEPLPVGNGLVVFVGSAATTLTYAGEVMTKDQPIALKGNGDYNITGNISPVEITLGDITPSADWVSGSDQLRTVKTNGGVDQSYTYATKAMFDDWGVPGYTGWYLTEDVQNNNIMDYTSLCKNAEPVAAGAAFYVLVSSAATTITIPSAL